MRILFADNDVDFLLVRTECLQNAGHEVLAVATVIQACALLRNRNCDMVIIDMRMENDNDEKDTTGLLLAREVDPEIPKIILTGYPSADLVAEALRQRPDIGQLACDFVAKEDGPEKLLEAVQRVIRTRTVLP